MNSETDQSNPSTQPTTTVADPPTNNTGLPGMQTRAMAAVAAQTLAASQLPLAPTPPSVATPPRASAAEVIINDHINALGMQLAQAVINQNNSLMDSILIQITTSKNALLALTGVPQTLPSPVSSASHGSSSTFSTEKRILSCMDKLPLWRLGHDPLLFLNDSKETCEGFSLDLADKTIRKRLFKYSFKRDPSLRAGLNKLLENAETWNDLSQAFVQDRLGSQWRSTLRNKIHNLTISKTESLTDFCDRFNLLVTYSGDPPDQYCASLEAKLPRYVTNALPLARRMETIHTLSQIIAFAKSIDRHDHQPDSRQNEKSKDRRSDRPLTSVPPPGSKPTDRCNTHPEAKHTNEQCRNPKNSKPNDSTKKLCFKCKAPWSKDHTCAKQTKSVHFGAVTSSDSTPSCPTDDQGQAEDEEFSFPPTLCSVLASNAPSHANDPNPKVFNPNEPKLNVLARKGITLPVSINDRHPIVILDTGATDSIVSANYVKSVDLPVHSSGINVTLANGSQAESLGQTPPLVVEANLITFSHSFIVMDLPAGIDFFFGLDLLDKLGIMISYPLPETPPPSNPEEKTPLAHPDPLLQSRREDLLARLKPLLEINSEIPVGAFCNHPSAVISLDTGTADPVYRRQYPIPHKLQEIVDDQVTKWLDNKIITHAPADSPYNSPLLVVPKKGNNHRVCIDPRLLNVSLKNSPTLTPIISDLFNQLTDAKYFSTLDYLHSFHQWKIRPIDQFKTTFTWKSQRYMFVGAPFGLKPLTGFIQHTQNEIFKNFPFVLCYVDDLVIFSKSLDEHYAHLSLVLQALNEFNLKLNVPKCCFLASEIILLGHVVSYNKIAIDQTKLLNLKDLPPPTTGSSISSFLGFVNYFRNFIPKYAHVAAPLESLRSMKSFVLNTSQKDAFDKLKYLLLNAPILHLPDFSKQFFVASDASNTGLGAILYQQVDHSRRFISFANRSLTASERNYSATKRELLAIVFALRKFHYYLYGTQFHLLTDHKALTYIFMQKQTNPMIIGWLETLLSYSFTISHLPGVQNVLPDHLSRVCASIVSTSPSTISQPSPHAPESGLAHSSPLTLVDPETLITPTQDTQKLLLDNAHLAGHFGTSALINKMKSLGYNWPNLAKACAQIVSNCTQCQRYNIQKVGFHPLNPIHASLPFDHIAIDLAGPFPTSQSGFNYVLVHVDLLTRFIILRPLQSKLALEVAQALFGIWTTFGFPKIVQSDNGGEFVNAILKELTSNLAIDHRLTTPYNPRSEGLGESAVKSFKSVFVKLIFSDYSNWEQSLPTIQYYINMKVRAVHGSTAFSLMFSRKSNPFQDYSNVQAQPLSPSVLKQRLYAVQSIVFPSISAKLKDSQSKMAQRFNKSHKILHDPFPDGSFVMRMDKTRTSSLQPRFEGPFKILKRTTGGSYVLQDSTGALVSRNSPPDHLKLISYAPDLDTQSYELEAILNHRGSTNNREYLVKWKNSKFKDSWIKHTDFDDLDIIRKYWKRLSTTNSKLMGNNVVTTPKHQSKTRAPRSSTKRTNRPNSN